MEFSNSKLKTYRRCAKQYQFKYVEGIDLVKKPIHLKRGSWLHELLMVHYDGEDWRGRQAELTTDFEKLYEEEQMDYGDLPAETMRIFTSYLQHYHKEDKGWRTIETEIDEKVPLPNGDVFRFIIDHIAEESDGGVWLWDHKTVGNFMDESFMLIDTQLARYFWAAKKLGIKNLRGVMFNEIITKAPTLPKLLQSGKALERRKNIHCDVYSYYREILKHGFDPVAYKPFLQLLKARSDQWFRRTRLPRDETLTKLMMREALMTVHQIKDSEHRNFFPRTPDKSCTWGCSYLDPCSIELMGGDISEVIKLKYEKRKEEDD